MGAEPTPVVVRLPAWSGRATLFPRPHGVPEARRERPIVSVGWDDCFVWKDRSDQRAGVTWFDTRIAWTCADLEEAVITTLVPARSQGGIDLGLRWKGDDAPSAIFYTDRWYQEDEAWFEQAAATLAKLLGVPLRQLGGADA